MRLTALALTASLLASTAAFAADMPAYTPPSKDIATAPSGTYEVDKNHGSITFKVMHMGFANYTMRFNDFDASITLDSAKPENSSVTATIIPASLDSHNQQLTQHTSSKEFFDIEQYPTISFASTKIEKTDSTHGKIYGNLTMHGVTKPVVLDTIFNGAGANFMSKTPTIGFSATTTVTRSEFGMGGFVPMVGDQVSVMIETEFAKK
jgi:polyisoprenoid-binding protein YceI